MTPLFSEAGMSCLDLLVKPGLICIFDFDGTLSPIVTQPHKAQLPLNVLQRLLELSLHAPIAIVTGRALADIQPRLGFNADFIAGNHGLEGLPGQQLFDLQYQAICHQWNGALAAVLEQENPATTGIWIENKGCSLSIHYRLARDHLLAEQLLPEIFSGLIPAPHVIGGKCVFNLLPCGAGNKGTAVERLIEISGATSAIYVGDDTTDEDVFRLNRPDLLSVRIERGHDTAAEFFVNHRLDVVQLLNELNQRLRQANASNWLRSRTADVAS